MTRWTERLLARRDPVLTLQQYLALREIAEESLTATDLARRAGVSGPAVSQLLAGLIDAGWVRRQRASDDRRRQLLRLTTTGEQALTGIDEWLTARVSVLLADVPAPELHALTRLLPVVRAALAGTAPPRRQAPLHPGPPPADPPGHRGPDGRPEPDGRPGPAARHSALHQPATDRPVRSVWSDPPG